MFRFILLALPPKARIPPPSNLLDRADVEDPVVQLAREERQVLVDERLVRMDGIASEQRGSCVEAGTHKVRYCQ
jgi:hypothetical protein